ncbi:MAG: A/G-specific adenine glycosylase [Bdellovibrionota bacterium]|nr:MAG: A/G-specific adenine glycosylase [Bdellovibrionota bacterium]
MKLSAHRISSFRRLVYDYYRLHGRRLPWRTTRDPYRILVSEVMLQQTQIARVLPIYRRFLVRFPNAEALARASLAEVLSVWQGLGYNRRAHYLHQTAQTLQVKYKGKVPRSFEELEALPGIGEYTAQAVMVFAFNQSHPLVETNIRSAILQEFFPRSRRVLERKVHSIVKQTIDSSNPREWFYALMDYGSHLKSLSPGINQRSAAYRKQSPFRGSLRQTRGAILRTLTMRGALSVSALRRVMPDHQGLEQAIGKLLKEGLLLRNGHDRLSIPGQSSVSARTSGARESKR